MKKSLIALLGSAAMITAASATSLGILTPNLSDPSSVTFAGATFVNKGLVGAGRLPASAEDFRGDTLGSFSSMAVVAGSWKRKGDSYTFKLLTLPDRGYNNGTTYSDYAGRVEKFDVTFTPGTSQTQDRVQLTPTGGLVFKDLMGHETTGANPVAGTMIQHGIVLPSPAPGALGAGKLSFDGEALSFLKDGSFYVGDEYGANIYYFGKDGKMRGVIQAPPSSRSKNAAGEPIFGVNPGDEAALNTTGRRPNQGFEGVSVSPDGKTLIAVMQSADLQDSTASGNQNRNNTRIFIYDIAKARTPSAPVHEYVLQLPVYRAKGDGGPATATAAQSEILALNNHQFLMLTRDGDGLGKEDGNPLVFKSIFIVEIKGASDIAGSVYDTTNKSIVTSYGELGGVLDAAVTPAQSTELINLINPAQLAKAGFTTAVTPLNPITPTNRVSEKWESLGLLPALDKAAPNDYFLLVGNDNDFLTAAGCHMPGVAACNGKVENDNMIMVWRVTLPTYGKN